MITFEELGVAPALLKAIKEMGFDAPMPIQEMVIPHLLAKEGDVVGLAQTGTGKTAAFGLPVLQRINIERCVPQALVIAPTRELCLQIAGDMADFAKYIDDMKILPVYGGSSIESQIRALKRGTQVIVATPGRLIDLINRGVVELADIHTVILDEADEMLNMGFLDDINEILSHVPEDRKMLMFSATMPKEIAGIAKQFMHEPVEFVAGNRNEGAENVKHIYYMVKAHDKYLALKRVADNNPDIYGIIFCRTRKETQEVADKLIADGYNADCLHGDLSQAQRDMAMRKFHDHVTQLLVATDVAARGLDVDDLTHVINYALPEETAVYTHRSGRTGRAGKRGVSVAIIHSREQRKLRDIEKIIGKEFEYRTVPSPEHIIEKQLYHLADRIERVEVNEEQIAKYMPGVSKKLEWLSGHDLLKRLLSLEFNRLLAYYHDMPDINLDADNRKEGKEKRAKRDRDTRTAESGMERLYVNVGKRQGFYPGNLMELVNANIDGAKPDIGRIDLLPDYTLFDVRRSDARRVVVALKGADFFGHRLYAEPAQEGKEYGAKNKGKGKKKERKAGEQHRSEPRPAAPGKKPKREKKNKSAKAEKPQYNGNYDIFIKKKEMKRHIGISLHILLSATMLVIAISASAQIAKSTEMELPETLTDTIPLSFSNSKADRTVGLDSLRRMYANYPAAVAFTALPDSVIPLLPQELRMNLTDYALHGDKRTLGNSMSGSTYTDSISANYLSVCVTDISSIQIGIYPCRKGNIAAICHTIAPIDAAADSELLFYDEKMQPLTLSKIMKVPTITDFLKVPNKSDVKPEELAQLIPFLTVVYHLDPAAGKIIATFTTEAAMTTENILTIAPYLVREIHYSYDGKRFKAEKKH